MSNWTQPLCAECWFKMEPVREPTRMQPAKVERCCQCDRRTYDGIYVRLDPEIVPFPTLRGGDP